MVKCRTVIVFEFVFLVTVFFIILNFYPNILHNDKPNGLLAPGVYAGVYESKTYQTDNFVPFGDELNYYIEQNKLNISIHIRSLKSGNSIDVNENLQFYPLSLAKLPLAVLIMHKIEKKQLSLDTEVAIKDEDRMDTYGDLYKTDEKVFTIKYLLEKMLKESDNTAFNILIRQVNEDDLNVLISYYSVDLNPYYNARRVNKHPGLMTAKIMSNVLVSLYTSSILDIKNSEYILSLLEETVFNIQKLAKLSDDVKIVHKFGSNYLNNNKFFHDCGIIYFPNERVLYCIMTKDLAEEDAADVVAAIVNRIYINNVITETQAQQYRR